MNSSEEALDTALHIHSRSRTSSKHKSLSSLLSSEVHETRVVTHVGVFFLPSSSFRASSTSGEIICSAFTFLSVSAARFRNYDKESRRTLISGSRFGSKFDFLAPQTQSTVSSSINFHVFSVCFSAFLLDDLSRKSLN
jgi:hypothetical protein